MKSFLTSFYFEGFLKLFFSFSSRNLKMLEYFFNCSINSTFCGNHFEIPNTILITKIILSVINVILNSIYLFLLFRKRFTLKWKRYFFIVNVSATDLVMGIKLIVMSILLLVKGSKLAIVFFEALVTGSMMINIFSYSGCIWLQYHAIRNPLHYKTQLTIARLKSFIFFLWITVYLYTILKWILVIFDPLKFDWISIGELSLLILVFFINNFAYFYILLVAIKHKTYCNNSFIELKMDSKFPQVVKVNITSRGLKDKRTFSNKYYFAMTLGLSWLMHCCTLLPLGAYWLMDEMSGRTLLFHNDLTKQIVCLCYYSRTIWDPLIHLYRESRFTLSKKWSLADTKNSTKYCTIYGINPL